MPPVLFGAKSTSAKAFWAKTGEALPAARAKTPTLAIILTIDDIVFPPSLPV
jgi:hypothetical protein